MWDVFRRSPLAVLVAVVMHLAIVLLMVFGLDWANTPEPVKHSVSIVQARLIDSEKLELEVKKLDKAKRDKAAAVDEIRKQEEQKLQDLKKKREAEKQKLAQLEKKQLQREKDAKLEKKKQADVKRKKEAEKKKQAKLENERKVAEEKRKAQAVKKKAEAEKKRKAKEEKKKAAEAKKKLEAEKKRKAVAAKKAAEKQAREDALTAEVEAEQDATELNQLVAIIQRKVEQNWRRPAGTAGLKCTVNVRLGSSGSVLLVKVVRSSGNGAFDRSVETAVRKADPLPMPKSPRLKAQFSDINFNFDPN